MRRTIPILLLLFTLFTFVFCGAESESCFIDNPTKSQETFHSDHAAESNAEDGFITVYLHLSCKQNALFNQYDLSVFLDGEKTAVLEHGASQTLELKVSEGSHTLQFQNTEDSSVMGTVDFTAHWENEFRYTLNCKRDQVEVKTVVPEAIVLETIVLETIVLETAAPETAAPETVAPETVFPETAAPETAAPETAVPETAAPETVVFEILSPETENTETEPSKSFPTENQSSSSSTSGGSGVTIPDHEETEGNLVWVPVKGGKKYHNTPYCSKMIDPMQVTVETAVANGYTPCKRCY